MSAEATTASRPSRPWVAFLAGGAAGFAILILTQVLSESRIAFGPFALYGNGALAAPLVGFPLAIYAGWTALADRHSGRGLLIHLATYSVGLVFGSFPLGLFFGLPLVLVTGAMYATWTRGAAVRKSETLLWAAFAISAVLAALPLLGIFGVALLPGSLILLAASKSQGMRIALGVLLVATTLAVGFAMPALLFGARTS